LVNSKDKKQLYPRLQAYERLTLLMERINPSQLVSRVNQYLMIKCYQNFIIAQIEQN
jgi:hypothetical protein